MRIHPQSPDPLGPKAGRPTGGKTPAERVSRPASSPAPTGADPADRVELSAEARDLAAALDADSPPSGGLGADVAARVGERLASGYYDRVAVREALVRRIADAFSREGGSSAERT
jgi:hypothetical protein